jgi:hypothetical protein
MSAGWGASQSAELAGSRVFVKRIPLTAVERAHMFSTRNRFRLPAFYHYGVGSAGFGVFRELAAHARTTAWVLDGTVQSFPLLYHARVMPRTLPAGDRVVDIDEYARRWNGSRAVARYMKARANADHEIWLVLEHFPYTLATWLPANQGAASRVTEQLLHTITLLRSRGIIHFDAHFWNVVGDGETWYLTDFGLLLDGEYELADGERAFLTRHSHFDYGESIASLGSVVLAVFLAMDPESRDHVALKYGIGPGADPVCVLVTLVERLEEIHAANDLPLDPGLVEAVTRHRQVILFMTSFLWELRRDRHKRTRYNDSALHRLLDAVGVPPY